MGLLDKIKSLFGSNQKSQSPGGRGNDPDVTVEREPSAESEHAVKGTGQQQSGQQQTGQPQGGQQQGQPQGGQQQGQPQQGQQASEATDGTGAEPAETEGEAPDESQAAAESPPVDEIKGIGPTYADRLSAAGIETVADLAAADAASVADAAQTGEGRAGDWVERAREF